MSNLPAPQEQSEPRWQRLSPDERREQIFACAKQLFSELPYAEVSLSHIASQAGVARGLVNHYFGSKREIYLEVIRNTATMPAMDFRSSTEGTMAERVDAGVAWFLDYLENAGLAWLSAMSSNGLGKDPELEQILITAENVSVDRLMASMGLSSAGGNRTQIRAMLRVFGQLARSGGREWLVRKTLSRKQTHSLLAGALFAIISEAIPQTVQSGGEHLKTLETLSTK
ncbi:transcriptional regulator, TetR family [Renibacterium salmoninarum ATCC 33209]|uniref:Transcriptional regulator, TetR family n=1 Tax=Renibacterium salmoninarum (strain ATCC 33209 / DSM 20767 / JCM 11484 / NBRC 15589 / NCIMB 2235) TaxID=288705 RepID=A9WVD0_RENSM|nr:TetR/AcrR family transcriptional regulator [Renibacterium salmoninarum]ABY25151.1 transcriptional regulator, TetR family [Renibacterium salmoninarum ATCC 33209]